MAQTHETDTLSNAQKVFNLTVELEKAKKIKKSVVSGHNDEIKRIQAEIKDLLTETDAD